MHKITIFDKQAVSLMPANGGVAPFRRDLDFGGACQSLMSQFNSDEFAIDRVGVTQSIVLGNAHNGLAHLVQIAPVDGSDVLIFVKMVDHRQSRFRPYNALNGDGHRSEID